MDGMHNTQRLVERALLVQAMPANMWHGFQPCRGKHELWLTVHVALEGGKIATLEVPIPRTGNGDIQSNAGLNVSSRPRAYLLCLL